MKKLKIFIFLCYLVLNEEEVELFSFEEEEPEVEESEEIIDNGCISSKPALCPDGICYPDYSECSKLSGCTTNQKSLMCPSGLCVESFENCVQSTYQCAIPEYQRCPDGLCRKDCSEIFTNGCNSQNPYYCPSGKCMKYQSQCIDYRCSIEQPYICNDLRCVAHPNSCPVNHSSYLIKEAENVFIINQIDQSKKFVNIFSDQHINLRAAKFTFMTNYLMYNKFTASYAKLTQKGVEEIELAIDFESYTKSQIDDSKVYYPETNLETEKLTNLIYSKEFGFLKPYEFIRSAVIQISIRDYEQNHFFFSKFPSIQFAFNKLYNYPNLNLQAEDIERINEYHKFSFNIHDPQNYYCLGVLDEASKLWRCASRKIIDFNDSTIEFKVPFPGIYAVLYYPVQEMNDTSDECGAVCAYRKFLMTLIVILIPVAYLLANYIHSEYGDEIEKEKQRILAMVKLGKKKRLTPEEIQQQEQEEEKALLEEAEGELQSQSSEVEIEIQEEVEEEEIQGDDLKEDNFDIQGQINVFVNPLVLTQDDDKGDKEEQSKLVKDKVKMKFKLSTLLKKKLKLLKKISTLSNQRDSLMHEIEKLTKLQGINDIIEKEPEEENK